MAVVAVAGVFARFWLADTVSMLGTFVSSLAIQFLLIDTLHADQAAIGVVRAAQWLPYLLLGLFAGVVVDRVRRRPLLVTADVVSAVALGTVAALAFAGSLTVPVLAALVFVAGCSSVFFTAAHQSFLPALVSPAELPSATARLEQTQSAAQSAGPLVGGALVRLLSAPVAVAVDALSFAVSAVLLSTVRRPEARPVRAPDAHVWSELREGARWVYRHPALGPYAVSLHLVFTANAVVTTVFVFFATTELHLDPVATGLVLAASGAAGVLGAGLAPRLAARYGSGRVHVAGIALTPVAYALLLPAAPGPTAVVWPLAANLLFGFAVGVVGPLHMTYRNAVTPDRLRGRMNATIRTFNWGTIAVAAPAGGWLAERAGNRAAFLVAVVGLAVAAVVVAVSPYRHTTIPTELAD